MEKGIYQKKSLVRREFSAGGVVFRKFQISNFPSTIRYGAGKFQIKWLVARSAPSKFYPDSYWRLPKGWLDDEGSGKSPGPLAKGVRRATEEDLQKTAIREVKEEGGVEAKIVTKLLTDRFFFTLSGKRILKFVTYYLMEWVKDIPEGPGMETSEVAWLSYEDIRAKLKHAGEKEVLDKAKEALGQDLQNSL